MAFRFTPMTKTLLQIVWPINANKGVRADGFSLHSNQRTSGFSLAPLCCLGEERTPIYQNFELLIYLVSFD